MSIANNESPNCTAYWDLPEKAQEAIDVILATVDGGDTNAMWTENGDKPSCPAKCRKCGQKRLRWNENNEHWCRRCRYTFFDEYFGD